MSASLIHFTNKDILEEHVYTASGSLTVPLGINQVWVEGCGGGGGGGTAAGNTIGGLIGGGGGAGAPFLTILRDVVPGEMLTITVGAGGASSAVGGNSTINFSIGGTLTLKGGNDGGNGTVGGASTYTSNPGVGGVGRSMGTYAGDGGANNTATTPLQLAATSGQGSPTYDAGATSGLGGGGSGGAGIGGNGGAGGFSSVGGAGQGYGAGGGGGSRTGPGSTAGGAGFAGIVKIYFVNPS